MHAEVSTRHDLYLGGFAVRNVQYVAIVNAKSRSSSSETITSLPATSGS